MGEFEGSWCYVQHSLCQHVAGHRMQEIQYPTSNLGMPQLYQLISKLEMHNITYLHTTQRPGTISIDEAPEKTVIPDMISMMQHILKARTHMVQSIYTHFDSSSQVIL